MIYIMPEQQPAASLEDIKNAKKILKANYPKKVTWEHTNDIHVLLDTWNLEKFAEENGINIHVANAALVEILNKRSQEPKII